MENKDCFCLTDKELQGVIDKVLSDAKMKRDNEAMGGGWTDGGAGRIESEVRFYIMGQKGEFPPEWESLLKDVRNEQDPLYAQYIKLKKKFEGG